MVCGNIIPKSLIEYYAALLNPDEHQELVTIYSHYLHEEKIIPIQLQEYINFYLKENSLRFLFLKILIKRMNILI